MNFDIAIVHHQIFSHEILQSLAINNIKLRIPLESVDHLINSLLKLIPVLLILLNFALGPRQIFIKFLEVIVIVYFFKFVLLGYLAELRQNFFAKLASFLGELLLHIKEVPIRPHARKHVIEKVIKLFSQGISDLDNLIPERNFMLGQILFYLVLYYLFSHFDILQRFLNFFFQGSFEVKLVH